MVSRDPNNSICFLQDTNHASPDHSGVAWLYGLVLSGNNDATLTGGVNVSLWEITCTLPTVGPASTQLELTACLIVSSVKLCQWRKYCICGAIDISASRHNVSLPQTVKQRMGAVLPDFKGTRLLFDRRWCFSFCCSRCPFVGSRIEFLPSFKDGPFQTIQKGPVFKANALRPGKNCPRNSHGCSSSPSLFLSMD